MPLIMDHLPAFVLATGALGTAAFGIVEALKWTDVGLFGFGRLTKVLGAPFLECLKRAYGPNQEAYLKALYRKGRTSGDLPRVLRQGARIGLHAEAATALADEFGQVVPAADLDEIVGAIAQGNDLTEAQRRVLGRFELAMDARIDAAMALADTAYVGQVRMLASGVAILLALIVAGVYSYTNQANDHVYWFVAFLVGVAAVPLAPIAKDLAEALKAAGRAIGRKAR